MICLWCNGRLIISAFLIANLTHYWPSAATSVQPCGATYQVVLGKSVLMKNATQKQMNRPGEQKLWPIGDSSIDQKVSASHVSLKLLLSNETNSQ